MTVLLRASVHFQYEDDVAASDQAINTFHFAIDPGNADAGVTSLLAAIDAFYTTSSGVVGHDYSLQQLMPNYTLFGDISTTLHFLDEATGLQVGETVHFDGRPTLTGSSIVPDGLPAEVALCLSYKCAGTIAEDVRARRKRGRLYFGPVGGGTATYTISPYSEPTEYIRRALLAGGQALVQRLIADAADVVWGVYSRPVSAAQAAELAEDHPTTVTARDGLFLPLMPSYHLVLGIPTPRTSEADLGTLWCDNEWDTQRRRGKRSDSRFTEVLLGA